MKTLVIGGSGILGTALRASCATRGHETIAASRSGPDVAIDVADPATIYAALDEVRPDLVVNCAAITNIDQCEAEPERASAINADPAAALAEQAQRYGFRWVQVSTDHFFCGDGTARHDEDAQVVLVNEYARTKHEAENHALESPTAIVVRTAFVGRAEGKQGGFAEWLHAAIKAGEPIVLFEDAYTSLLHSGAVAEAILDLAELGAGGLFNVASRDVFTKADLIRSFAEGVDMTVTGESGSVSSQKIPRADSLALDPAKVEAVLGRPMPGFEDTVRAMVADFAQ